MANQISDVAEGIASAAAKAGIPTSKESAAFAIGYHSQNASAAESAAPAPASACEGHSHGREGENMFGTFKYAESVTVGSHPEWHPPAEGDYRGLNVVNTLTGTKVKFIPTKGQRVLWYTCGPTVYDYSHMGHARAYLTFDILRRIMEDYFGYNITYQTNITDIDDKIILRARHNKLMEDYRAKKLSLEQVTKDVAEAIAAKAAKMTKRGANLAIPKTDSRQERERVEALKVFQLKHKQFKDLETRVQMAKDEHKNLISGDGKYDKNKSAAFVAGQVKAVLGGDTTTPLTPNPATLGDQMSSAYKAFAQHENSTPDRLSAIDNRQKLWAAISGATDGAPASALITLGKAVLSEWLDKQFGATVTDHSVFDKLSREFERYYQEDMAALGIKDADVITRVTEYVPQIMEYVEVIESKGLAYESQGSVYLDTVAFKKQGHNYRKLKPHTGATTEDEMAESEGALGSSGEKRTPNDFALWKASKPGEPAWKSKWGMGRPGWHIECSVVASDILGRNMDIHAGGQDLRFPHHDNELAQSECFYGHQQWVNYFFHAGWLKIKGLKMSKSLKNFITIRQALEDFSARQLRLMFLLQAWDKDLNFSDQTVGDAKAKESLFVNFFGAVKDLLRDEFGYLTRKVGWLQREQDKAFMLKAVATKDEVHEAFCDNFDTRRAMVSLCDLVTAANIYMEAYPSTMAVMSIKKAAIFVTQILKVVGVIKGNHSIGFAVGGGGGSKEKVISPYVNALQQFREKVRMAMLKGPKGPTRDAVLAMCGELRDEVLPPLGVRLEDTGDESRWRLDDPAVLMRELAAKKEAAEAKKREKRKRLIAQKKTALQADRQAALPPTDIFKSDPRYSAWDPESGLPTLTADGKEVTARQQKKLGKKVKAHKKKHDRFMGKVTKAGAASADEYFAQLEAEIAKLETA